MTHQTGSQAFRYANEQFFFSRGGLAFSMIGASFSGRAHRYAGVFGGMGRSVFPAEQNELLCLLNSAIARRTMESLNPTVHFNVGDVNRLPLFSVREASTIVSRLDEAFTEHESHRENSVEFRRPGPSPWRHVQDWAQNAVDRPEGEPLPPYEPEYDAEPPTDHLSFALG